MTNIISYRRLELRYEQTQRNVPLSILADHIFQHSANQICQPKKDHRIASAETDVGAPC